MDILSLIKSLAEGGGISTTCIISLVCIWVLYRLLIKEKESQKDASDKIVASLDANTAVTIEVKTLIETWLRFIKGLS